MRTSIMKLVPQAATVLLVGVIALDPSLARAQTATETPCPGGKKTCPHHDVPQQSRTAVEVNAAPGDKKNAKKPAPAATAVPGGQNTERRSGAVVASDAQHQQRAERPFTEATITEQRSGSAPKTSTAPAASSAVKNANPNAAKVKQATGGDDGGGDGGIRASSAVRNANPNAAKVQQATGGDDGGGDGGIKAATKTATKALKPPAGTNNLPPGPPSNVGNNKLAPPPPGNVESPRDPASR